MALRIAIDINDVIRDNLSQFITYYKKGVNSDFDINKDGITSFDIMDSFPFESYDSLNKFRFEDFPYELYGRAEPMDKVLPYRLNDWIQNTMRDFDEECIPEILFFSPFEIGMTIQSTYAFLARTGCRVREIHFPINSYKMWEKCDIMITANPNLLSSVTEGNMPIKINAPYNKDIKVDITFNSLLDLIQDKDDTIIKLIENSNG